jgi:hypothetical protein
MPQYLPHVTFDTQKMLSIFWKTICICGFQLCRFRSRFRLVGTCRALGRFQPIPNGSQNPPFLCVMLLVVITSHSQPFFVRPDPSIGPLAAADESLAHRDRRAGAVRSPFLSLLSSFFMPFACAIGASGVFSRCQSHSNAGWLSARLVTGFSSPRFPSASLLRIRRSLTMVMHYTVEDTDIDNVWNSIIEKAEAMGSERDGGNETETTLTVKVEEDILASLYVSP